MRPTVTLGLHGPVAGLTVTHVRPHGVDALGARRAQVSSRHTLVLLRARDAVAQVAAGTHALVRAGQVVTVSLASTRVVVTLVDVYDRGNI